MHSSLDRKRRRKGTVESQMLATLAKTVVRLGSFTQRVVVNAWNGLPGNVVAADTVDRFNLKFDRYL